jgi:catechol 2,3-dioxygenase-like lactoylglutathione lyase family enzyme
MAILGRLYHVGIVVRDIESAKAHFTDLLGITWGPVLHVDEYDVRAFDLESGAGTDLVFPNTLCYSTEAPHLELVEEVPGSVWECNEHSNLHHIGVWTDALPADSAHYRELRCPLQLCGHDGETAPIQFAYHRDPLGVRIELVDAAMKPIMEEFMFKAPVA